MDDYKEIYEHKITEENREGLVVKWEMDGDEEFEPEAALAALLIEKQVFLNNHWWEKQWDERQRETFSINVNCSDVFAWGCADAEEAEYKDLEDLFEHWLKDPSWGVAVWCIKKRGALPQEPVFEAIQEAGVWDLRELGITEGYGWKLPR